MDVLAVDADASMRYTRAVRFCQDLVGVGSIVDGGRYLTGRVERHSFPPLKH